jgi:glutaredoxin
MGHDRLTVLTLYGRPGCHLCDEAREALAALRDERRDFRVEEVDIDRDERLLAAYLERIPVIAVGEEVISELVPDLDAVSARLDTLQW